MKIRTDYVSNSSSSSFVIIGVRMDNATFDVNAFAKLDPHEGFILVLPSRGTDGDYVFRLTPELLMDFDMHQIDLTKSDLPIIKVKCSINESGYVYRVSGMMKIAEHPFEYVGDEDVLANKSRLTGMKLDCSAECKLFRINLDYDNPKSRMDIIEEVKNTIEFSKPHHEDEDDY